MEIFKSSFNGGEIDVGLQQRVDLEKFQKSVAYCENMVVMPTGGLRKRPGTFYINRLGKKTKAVKLIPFKCSNGDKFLVEINPSKIRIFNSNFSVIDLFNHKYYEPNYNYKKMSKVYIDKITTVQLSSNGEKIFFYDYYNNLNKVDFFKTDIGIKKLSLGFDGISKKFTFYFDAGFSYDFNDFRNAILEFFPTTTNDINKIKFSFSEELLNSSGVVLDSLDGSEFFPETKQKWYYCKKDTAVVNNYVSENIYNTEYWEERSVEPYGFDTPVFEINVSFNEYDIQNFKYTNINDILILVNPKYPPKKISYNGNYSFSFSDFNFDSTPFMLQNVDTSHTMDITIESNEYYLNSSKDFFSQDMVGGFFKLKYYFPQQEFSASWSEDSASSDFMCNENSVWRINVTGDATGVIFVEKKKPGESTYEVLRSLVINSGNPVYVITGEVSELSYIRIRFARSGGTARVSLVIDSFFEKVIAKITGYISQQKVKVSLDKYVTNSSTYRWSEGSFSYKNGFPCCVSLFENRLVFGGTKTEPFTVWFSKTDNFYDFDSSIKIKDDDGISVTLNSGESPTIVDVKNIGKFIVLCDNSEWVISGGEQGIKPTNININKISNFGCEQCGGVSVGDSVIYMQRNGSTIREISYSLESDSLRSVDINITAKSIFSKKKAKEIHVQKEPFTIIWVVMDDGTCINCTFSKEYDVLGYWRFTTNGEVLSLCITEGEKNNDKIYYAIRRPVNYYYGKELDYPFGDVYNLEFSSGFIFSEESNEFIYSTLDCCLLGIQPFQTNNFDSLVSKAESVFGINYMNDIYYVCRALYNGVYYILSRNGYFNKGNFKTKIVLYGWRYSCVFNTLPINDVGNGRTNNRFKINDIGVYFVESIGGRVIVNGYSNDINPQQNNFFTGFVNINLTSSSEVLPSIGFDFKNVYPCYVLSIVPRIV